MADNGLLDWTKLGLTTVGATIVFGIGLFQYVTTSAQTARQPFLQTQTELCLRASEHAARLATTTDRVQWKKSSDEFWTLYLGPLAVVERVSPEGGENTVLTDVKDNFTTREDEEQYTLTTDERRTIESVAKQQGDPTLFKDVETRMVIFAKKLRKIPPETALPVEALSESALHISRACQRLVTSWWSTRTPEWLRWLGAK
jgi:hypothetical protein